MSLSAGSHSPPPGVRAVAPNLTDGVTRGRHRAAGSGATRRLVRTSGACAAIAAVVVVVALTVIAVQVLRTGVGCADCTPLGRGTLVLITLAVGWGVGVPLLRYGARRWRENAPPAP